MESQKCKICGQEAEVLNGNGWLHIVCIRCGDYFITSEVIDDNQKELNDQIIITKISGWIRENPREKIDSEKFNWLLSNLAMPNVYEKAQRLIKCLNKKTIYPSQAISVNLVSTDAFLIELLSVCWAHNEKEVRYLIDYLSDKGFLKKNPTNNNINISLTITPEGFSYIEDMQRNQNSNL